MAYLDLDSKNLVLTVKLGPLEHYRPDKEIKQIFKDVKSLGDETKEFMVKLWGEKSLEEIQKLLDTDKEINAKWVTFLQSVYNKKLEAVIKKIKAKNIKIYNGFKELENNREKKE